MDEVQKSHYDISLNPEEFRTLEIRWKEGDLNRRVAELGEFIKRHREDIRIKTGLIPGDQPVLEVIKQLIIEYGTVDHAAEMMDQAQEIRAEIWIRGEHGDQDRVNILQEWTARHAFNWRHWRIKVYLFVADRCALELWHTMDS